MSRAASGAGFNVVLMRNLNLVDTNIASNVPRVTAANYRMMPQLSDSGRKTAFAVKSAGQGHCSKP